MKILAQNRRRRIPAVLESKGSPAEKWLLAIKQQAQEENPTA